MLGHDFAFVPAHQEEGEAVLDRLYVTAADGNQTFAFEFVRGSNTGPELKPVEVYLPMRLFGGKALVAAGMRAILRLRRALDSVAAAETPPLRDRGDHC